MFVSHCSERFAPDLDPEVVAPWRFVDSPRNITIERGWRPLFYKWGVNILHFYNAGRFGGDYHADNVLHQYACFLWIYHEHIVLTDLALISQAIG